MSKAESRQGNPNLPVGQAKGGFPADDLTNPKQRASFMSIGAPADPMEKLAGGIRSISNGFRDAPQDGLNKVNGPSIDSTDYDERVRANYESIVDGPSVSTTLVNANRLRQGITPGDPAQPLTGVPIVYSGDASVTGSPRDAQQQ